MIKTLKNIHSIESHNSLRLRILQNIDNRNTE